MCMYMICCGMWYVLNESVYGVCVCVMYVCAMLVYMCGCSVCGICMWYVRCMCV